MIRILGTILAALLGLAFGSFLNVCLSRWPQGESVVKPRSHCRNCGRTLLWWENVPLVSWIGLRGQCRTCKTKIGWRYPLVELAVGVLWAVVGWRLFDQILSPTTATLFAIGPPYFGFIPALETMFFVLLLVGLAVLDAEHLWIADAATLPGIALGLAIPIFQESITGMLPKIQSEFWVGLEERLLAIIAAGGIILLIRWSYRLIRKREGIGLGDAKLMAMLGAWLGLPGALLSLAAGVLLGTLFSLIVLAFPAMRRESNTWQLSKLPLGTFICMGGIISVFWGPAMIAAYEHLVGL